MDKKIRTVGIILSVFILVLVSLPSVVSSDKPKSLSEQYIPLSDFSNLLDKQKINSVLTSNLGFEWEPGFFILTFALISMIIMIRVLYRLYPDPPFFSNSRT